MRCVIAWMIAAAATFALPALARPGGNEARGAAKTVVAALKWHSDSEWRTFRLPFRSKPGLFPTRIEVNVVVPDGGEVRLGPAKLLQFDGPSVEDIGITDPTMAQLLQMRGQLEFRLRDLRSSLGE